MSGSFATAERAALETLAKKLPAMAERLPPVFCGFGACVDRTLSLDDILPTLLGSADPVARSLAAELADRAQGGVGGEICWQWPGGARVLGRKVARPAALGGSAAQAAQQLALLGARPLLAIEDRNRDLLGLLHRNIRLAIDGKAVPAAAARHGEAAKPAHFIIEYVGGREVCGVSPPRSNRVIVRLAEDGLEQDAAFAQLSRRLAGRAGAAILSGFNSLPEAEFDDVVAWARTLAVGWRDSGVPIIHMEFADFPIPEHRWRVLRGLDGAFTSLGMNLGELHALMPGSAPVADKARQVATELALDRVNIHADEWALSLTKADPETELNALRGGCLTASTRAALGRMSVPTGVPAGARLTPPPWPAITGRGSYSMVACAAPHLPTPRSTIGLGDTFLAGTLVVLAQPEKREREVT